MTYPKDERRLYNGSEWAEVMRLLDPGYIAYLKDNDLISTHPLLSLWKLTQGAWSIRQGFTHHGAIPVREFAVESYAWAVPGHEALYACSGESKLVEMGAGTGYWSELIRQYSGRSVEAFDGFDSGGFGYRQEDVWGEVFQGGPEALLDYGSGWTLLMVWPPYDKPFGTDCLLSFHGDRIIYVGEGYGGATGDEMLDLVLETAWDEVATAPVPQWEGINDFLTVYERAMPQDDVIDAVNEIVDNNDNDYRRYYRLKNPEDSRNRRVGRRSL